MWPFRRKKKGSKKGDHVMRKVVVGLIISGAIGSIIGKKLIDQHLQDEEKTKED